MTTLQPLRLSERRHLFTFQQAQTYHATSSRGAFRF